MIEQIIEVTNETKLRIIDTSILKIITFNTIIHLNNKIHKEIYPKEE